MKKNLFALLAAAGGLFTACGEADYEAHQTYFYPQHPGGMQLYADQTADTLHIVSLDSWTAAPSADWLSVSPTSEKIPAGYILDRRIDISATPNATGKNRAAHISVNAYGNTFTMPVLQASWLDITSPQPQIDMNTAFETRRPSFVMNLKAAAADTTIVFHVYQDGATLQSADTWLVPEATSFAAGRHSVKVSFQGNPSNQPRETRLTLTSAGVSTEIEMKQRPLK